VKKQGVFVSLEGGDDNPRYRVSNVKVGIVVMKNADETGPDREAFMTMVQATVV
jgi:hypothetical protein